MSLEDDLQNWPTTRLESRRDVLQTAASASFDTRKGKNRLRKKREAQVRDASAELEIVERVLSVRIEEVRAEALATLITEGVSALKIDDWVKFRQLEGDLSEVIQQETIIAGAQIRAALEQADTSSLNLGEAHRLYQNLGYNKLLTSAFINTLDNQTASRFNHMARGFSWVLYEGKLPPPDTLSGDTDTVYLVPPEVGGGSMESNLMKPMNNTVCVKGVPVSKEWASIGFARMGEYIKLSNSSSPMSTQGADLFEGQAMELGIHAAESLSTPERRYKATAAEAASQHTNPSLSVEVLSYMAEKMPNELRQIIDSVEDTITTKSFLGEENITAPRSVEELMFRLETHFYALALESNGHQGAANGRAHELLLKGENREKVFRFAKQMMDTVPEHASSLHPEFVELLEVMCPELVNNEEFLSRLLVIRAGGRFHVVVTSDISDEFHERYANQFDHFPELPGEADWPDADRRMLESLVRQYKPGDTTLSTSFPLGSIEELEAYFFQSEDIEGRFLPKPERDGDEAGKDEDSDDAAVPSNDLDPADNWHALPRMQALRSALLREQVHATYSYDESESADLQDYAGLERGNRAVVTIDDLNLQVIISDDPQLGCYQVFNNNAPINYTKVLLPEISQMGATPIRWESPEQFTRSIRTSIRQQKEHPITVYPVHPTVQSTPIDDLIDNRSESASLEHLQYDLERAAAACGKEDVPWTLTTGDFSKIQSGNILWSFGGNAHGITYLSRVGRRMGFDNREAADENLQQRKLAPLTLRWILRAVYPEQTSPIFPRPSEEEEDEF